MIILFPEVIIKVSLYNQVMVFYVSRGIFHSGGAWYDSGDVILSRGASISRVIEPDHWSYLGDVNSAPTHPLYDISQVSKSYILD